MKKTRDEAPVFSPGEYTFSRAAKTHPLTRKVSLFRLQDGKPSGPPDEIHAFQGLELVSKRTRRFGKPDLGVWPPNQAPRGQWLTRRMEVSTEDGDYWIEGKPFTLDVLHVLLSLRERGQSEGTVRFFFFNEDRFFSDDGGLHKIFNFFVVSDDDAIVMDSVSFQDNEGFTPEAFSAREPSPQAVAYARYWYRRFCTKTRMGEYIMLRPDQPPLFYFDGTRLDHGALLETQVSLLARIRRLLFWLVLAVVGVGLVVLLRR